MPARGRVAVRVAGGFGVIILLMVGAVLVLTQTEWGREKVRQFALDRLDAVTDGEVRIERIGGNLLRGIRLIDVRIVDEQGRPFLSADTVATRFSLLSLLRQRIVLTNVQLARPEIVLDRPPGEDWNYVRIFRIDPDTIDRDPGWGDWIALTDVRITDGRLTVRTAWRPPDGLTGPDRERALRRALSRETRHNIVQVRGGYQNVMEFRELNIALPQVVPAHPDTAGIPIEVERFSGIIQPFLPPAAVVRDLSGRFRLEADSLHFTEVQAVLPGTRLAAQGVYALPSAELVLQARGAPMAFADMRWLYPPLPEEGGGPLTLHVELGNSTTRVIADEMDLQYRDARIAGRIDLTTGDTLRVGPSDVRFARLPTQLVHEYVPAFVPPRPGRLTGRIALRGVPEALRVDGDVTFADDAGDASRVLADGEFGVTDAIAFRELRLQFRPLQARLVQAVVHEVPVRGTIEGTVTLNGAPAARLGVRADLVHHDAGQRSHVTGRADLVTAGDRRAIVDARLQPLSLTTVGRFAPGAGLHGSVAGRLRADGRLDDLRVSADLNVTGGGAIRADGVIDIASDRPGYGLDMAMRAFDMAAITRRAPATTSLTGTVTARGRGVDPVTMDAVLAADLVDSEVDDVAADVVRVRLAIADGLAAVDSSVIRLGSAEAVLSGHFGLAADRRGELHYRVVIDSLREAAAAATARRVPADSVAGSLTADSVGGSLTAEGILSGGVQRFDVRGYVDMDDVLYDGAAVGRGRAEYVLADVGTHQLDITLAGTFDDVVAAGLEYDHVAVAGEYRGGRYGQGAVVLSARQDGSRDLRVDAEFALSTERSELRLQDVMLRLDTVVWQTAAPGTVSWDGSAIEVGSIDIVSSHGGRIHADGRLPTDGSGDLDLVVQELEIAQFIALLRQDTDATGRLDLEAHVSGTLRSPVMRGVGTLIDATVDGDDAPDARITFSYADRELSADAELVDEGKVIVVAEASLPIDLGLTGDVPQRLWPGPLTVDIRADSLPVESLPVIMEQVDDVAGRIAGDITVRGTFDAPVLAGAFDIDLASVRIVPVDVRFEEVRGSVSMAGSTVTIDSIVARSGGPIRITGDLDVSTLSVPVFDLAIDSEDALIIDTDDVSLRVDAEVAVTGPLTALEVTGDALARSGMWRIPELADVGTSRVVNLDEPETFAGLDTIFVAEREALAAPSPVLGNMDLDIALTIDRDVWLRSTEANVEIYTPREVGPLRIRMTPAEPGFALDGTINTDRGEYEFMSRRFALTRGALTFTGEAEINPIIQVAAEHEVRLPGREAFQIRVVLGGTVRDLTIALESSAQPPIAQTDLLSYLAFGRDASSLLTQQASGLSGESGTAGALVGNVAGLATHQLVAVAMEAAVTELEMGAMRDLGLDVFRITPADLPAELFTGRYSDVLRGTEIEAGRYVSPRLFVAGQVRAGLNRPGIRMEYRTPGGFQWLASWQPRFLPTEPTLTDPDPRRGGVIGGFLFREWRF